jgi:RimJ/RimL family protein N-acetyltransferase
LETTEQTHKWLSGLLPENQPGSDNYAIFIKDEDSDENTVIGVVGVHRIEPTPEIGYIFHPSTWGKGYATEAVGAFIEHFWQARSDLDTIEARVDEENTSSRRVLYKCGFVEVETVIGGAEQAWLDPPLRNVVVYRIRRN